MEPNARSSLLDLFKIHKASYEIGYESANRPTWLSIPLRGLLDLLGENPAERMTANTTTKPTWRPDDAAVKAIVEGRHGDPFAILGTHGGGDAPISVRVFWPGAKTVAVVDRENGETLASLEPLHKGGFFAGLVTGLRPPFAYQLRFTADEASWEAEDPYRFPPLLGDLDVYLMAEGSHRRIFERLGAHPTHLDGVDGVAFAVWAPNAKRVSVVGDFNHWDGRRHPMRKRIEAGVWELFIPGVARDDALQVRAAAGGRRPAFVEGRSARLLRTRCRRQTASIVVGLPHHDWDDDAWMAERRAKQALSRAALDLRGASRLLAAEGGRPRS